MPQTLRIITRESRLALWQTNAVTAEVRQQGHPCTIIPIKSTGDVDLVNPIYEIGVQGVFTKELDSALLAGEADAAVHSLKDVPVVLAKGLRIAAILKRGPFADVLFSKSEFFEGIGGPRKIATSSIRRRAQWLEKNPNDILLNVRGNVETRIRKFQESDWDGMIMARAGVERLAVNWKFTSTLSWMLPSPAQGAIAVVCRESDPETAEIFKTIHHEPTALCVNAERDFLRHLHGGCSVPISALAQPENGKLHFKGAVHSMDGSKSFRVERIVEMNKGEFIGKLAAQEVLENESGRKIVDEIQSAKPHEE
jgi:hydroxymethylbilane synthase